MDYNRQKQVPSQFILLIAVMVIIISSCVPQKKVEYVQDSRKAREEFDLVDKKEQKIQPGDQLYITVQSFDELNFNFFSQASQSAGLVSEQALALSSFSVNDSGYIYYPILGHLLVKDLTITAAAEKLKTALSVYFNQPTVVVRFVNKQVYILGEVRLAGPAVYTKEHLNVFQALSMAGDITEFGNRKKVYVIREHEGKVVRNCLDLTNIEVFESEFYQVEPNDIIYVKPYGEKRFAATTYQPINLLLTSVTTILLLLTFLKSN